MNENENSKKEKFHKVSMQILNTKNTFLSVCDCINFIYYFAKLLVP